MFIVGMAGVNLLRSLPLRIFQKTIMLMKWICLLYTSDAADE